MLPYVSIENTPFGRRKGHQNFSFDPVYVPPNHGSFGADPDLVRAGQVNIYNQMEAQPDRFIRFGIPNLRLQNRSDVAKLLGVPMHEVVCVPNAMTTVNTVLRNLKFVKSDRTLYFSFAQVACIKTIEYIWQLREPKADASMWDFLLATLNFKIYSVRQ
ncbi:hypothetical protein MMC21_002151 [Puttea exsequens]|nr:hypothetical protein [Puttea exsequens]